MENACMSVCTFIRVWNKCWEIRKGPSYGTALASVLISGVG